jgi:hypothetical protein
MVTASSPLTVSGLSVKSGVFTDELSFDAELSVKSYGFTDKVRGEMPLRVLAIAFI